MMRAYFAIPGAAGGLFFSSWVAMLFWGTHGLGVGLASIGYDKAMVLTIALWLVVAPFAGAVAGRSRRR